MGVLELGLHYHRLRCDCSSETWPAWAPWPAALPDRSKADPFDRRLRKWQDTQQLNGFFLWSEVQTRKAGLWCRYRLVFLRRRCQNDARCRVWVLDAKTHEPDTETDARASCGSWAMRLRMKGVKNTCVKGARTLAPLHSRPSHLVLSRSLKLTALIKCQQTQETTVDVDKKWF